MPWWCWWCCCWTRGLWCRWTRGGGWGGRGDDDDEQSSRGAAGPGRLGECVRVGGGLVRVGLRLGSSEGASREGRSRLGANCRLFVSHRSLPSCSRTTSLRLSTSKITSSFLWVSPSPSRTRATARRPARLARRPENVLVVGAIPAAAQRARARCQATSASLRASCARAHAGDAQVRLPLPPPPSPSLVVSPSRTVEAHDVQTFTYQLILPPGSNSPCSWRTKPGSLTLSEASTCDDDDEEARSGRGPAAGAGPLAPRQQQPSCPEQRTDSPLLRRSARSFSSRPLPHVLPPLRPSRLGSAGSTTAHCSPTLWNAVDGSRSRALAKTLVPDLARLVSRLCSERFLRGACPSGAVTVAYSSI